jgi:glycine cleavage system T protein (aminomethyltransferase)
MVNFGGWDMPLEYSGIVSEHMAVRTRAGLFDVSHMGEIEVRGPRALDLIQWVTCNDAARLQVGQAQYSGLMTERGGFVDDLLVHKLSDTHYLLCVNASNQDRDFSHILRHNRFGAQVENAGPRYTQLAVQGPRALAVVERFTRLDLASIRYYHFTRGQVDGVDCLVARTGYTGEDGVELYFSPEHSEKLWNDLIEAGRGEGLVPCGLGARNTLRMEAAMCLYGHEIDETTSPLEANLGWIAKLDKGDFLGRKEILRQKELGLTRRLVGFEMVDRAIARDNYPVLDPAGDADPAGRVTSGGRAPFLKIDIGMAYVPISMAALETPLTIEIRGRRAVARVVPMPFYKRPR